MPRYSLRTLIIVMLLAGPVLAGAWYGFNRVKAIINRPFVIEVYTPVLVEDASEPEEAE